MSRLLNSSMNATRNYDSFGQVTPLIGDEEDDILLLGDASEKTLDELFRFAADSGTYKSEERWKSADQMKHSKRRYDIVLMMAIWIVWLFLGWLFYINSTCCDGRWGMAFYMAVNVGYSIGWTVPDTYEDSASLRYFSSFYLSVGAVLIFGAITYFVDMVIQDTASRYRDIEVIEESVHRSTKEMDRSVHGPSASSTATSATALPSGKAQVTSRYAALMGFAYTYREVLVPVVLFITWLIWGILWSRFSFGDWKFSESLYFALSTLSAGGLYSIPDYSDDTSFAVAGIFAATGIPIAMIATANVAKLIIELLSSRKMAAYLDKKLSKADFDLFQAQSIDPVTKKLDLNKFLLLVFVRQRAIDLRLVELVLNRLRSDSAERASAQVAAIGRKQFIL